MTCSQHNPAEQTTLAYDDTESFGLPHFTKRDYKGLTSSRYEVIPFLIEDYGRNKRSYIYTSKGRFKKGGNRLCTELYYQLRAIKFSGTRAAHARKLVMIADNASENKNNTLLAFDHDLVYHGWYDEVIRLYGLVGHTHNGIDGNHQIHNEVFAFVSSLSVRLVHFMIDFTRCNYFNFCAGIGPLCVWDSCASGGPLPPGLAATGGPARGLYLGRPV
jgi:hypothetical protein